MLLSSYRYIYQFTFFNLHSMNWMRNTFQLLRACATRGGTALSCILCCTGCADTTQHLTEMAQKKISRLLIHRLPGTCNEAQTLSSAWESSPMKTEIIPSI